MTAALRSHYRVYNKPCKDSKQTNSDILLFIFASVFTVCLLMGLPGMKVFAADKLTDMFMLKSFRGSNEALANAGWLSTALHYVISWFSFLGLCLTLYQKFITLLYLSARNLFDTIYEIKTTKMKGSGFAGLKGLFEMVKTGDGAGGGGFDVFITFVYGLLPNIKAYSDYCPDKLRDKLEETDGPTQYMLKTAIPTIMLIFFLTIGYSGTLGKAYGMIVDGMATAADNLVTKNLGAWVNKMINEGDGYQFVLGGLGTEGGKFADKIAREMYSQILGMCDNTTPEFRQRLGMVIEESVYGGGNMPNRVPPTVTTIADSILGGTNDGYATLSALVRASMAKFASSSDSGGDPEVIDTNGSLDDVYEESVVTKLTYDMTVSLSSKLNETVGISWSIKDIVSKTLNEDTGKMVSLTTLEKYINIVVRMDNKTNSDWRVRDQEQQTIGTNVN